MSFPLPMMACRTLNDKMNFLTEVHKYGMRWNSTNKDTDLGSLKAWLEIDEINNLGRGYVYYYGNLMVAFPPIYSEKARLVNPKYTLVNSTRHFIAYLKLKKVIK